MKDEFEFKYFDRSGKQIHAGDTIHCILDNSNEKVYACGEMNLGIKANKGPIAYEFYPLSEFDTDNDWEIVEN